MLLTASAACSNNTQVPTLPCPCLPYPFLVLTLSLSCLPFPCSTTAMPFPNLTFPFLPSPCLSSLYFPSPYPLSVLVLLTLPCHPFLAPYLSFFAPILSYLIITHSTCTCFPHASLFLALSYTFAFSFHRISRNTRSRWQHILHSSCPSIHETLLHTPPS